jgi:hypothetical protein
MSDTMLCAVLMMPREMREADMLSRMQFDARVTEAAAELEKRATRIQELEKENSELKKEIKISNGHLLKITDGLSPKDIVNSTGMSIEHAREILEYTNKISK